MSMRYGLLGGMILLSLFSRGALYGERSYTWKECVELTERSQPDLVAAREKVLQAKAAVGVARSGYLPQVDAVAGVSRSRKEFSEPYSGSKTADTYSYGVKGRQLLFDGMKSVYDIKAAGKNLEEAEYQFQVVSAAVRLSLRQAFVQLLKTQETVKITKEIADRRKRNLQLVRMRYRAGREHKGALMTAQASLGQADYEHAQALRNRDLAQRQLVKEMGLRYQEAFSVTGEFTVEVAQREKPDFDRMVERNPNLQRAIKQREAAEYAAKAARSGWYPTIDAYGSAGKTGPNFPPANTEWAVGLEMTYPLFQGGATHYGSAKAEAQMRQLKAEVISARAGVLIALEQKWINLQNEIDRVKVQYQYLQAAEERSRIAEAQYNVGFILFDNWIIIEDALANAKKSYLEAKAGALVAEAEWLQAKGETLSYDK